MTRTSHLRATRTALAATAAAALVLTGCSSQDPSGPGGFDPDEEITLTVSWWGNDTRAAIMSEVFDMFTEEYPNITVVGQPVGSPDDLFNRLATDFAGGGTTAPDLFALGGAKPQEYGETGQLLDLATVSNYLDVSKYADFTTTNATVDGTLYGLPTGGNAIGVLINKDIFAQAGVTVPTGDWTWEQFVDIANQISANTPGNIVGLDLRIQDILGTYVGQYTDTGIYGWDGQLSTDASNLQRWYELELALLEGGGLPDPSVVVEHWNVTPDQTLFGIGRAAITFSYTNQIAAYSAGTGGAEVDIIAPPSSTGALGVAVLPSQFWAINANSAHKEAAALLLDWVLNQPEPAKVIKADRGLPFNPDVLAVVEPLLGAEDSAAAAYLQVVLDGGLVAPPQPSGGAILNELSQRKESDVLFGSKSPAQAAEEWIAELHAALN